MTAVCDRRVTAACNRCTWPLLSAQAEAIQEQAHGFLGERASGIVKQLRASSRESDRIAFAWAAVLLGVACVLYVVVLSALRRSVSTVVGIVTEATRVVSVQPTLILIPFASLGAVFSLLLYGALVLAYLATSTPTPAAVASALGAIEGDIAAELKHAIAGSVSALSSLEQVTDM